LLLKMLRTQALLMRTRTVHRLALARTFAVFQTPVLRTPNIFWTDDKDKPPKGFERFSKDDKKEEKKEEEAKKEEGKLYFCLTKIENEKHDHDHKEESTDKSKSEDKMGGINKYLFDPEGDPKPEGWIGLLLIACGLAYAINQMTSKPMEEIVYMDFLNKYLMPGHVKEINLTKDRRTEVFNFRAEIEMTDGKKFYMILGSHESFLAKLDMVQRQMGKHPNQFIPVKYVNESETTGS